MEYGALTALVGFASFQFILSFNFHRTYMKLYNDFKLIIDKIVEKREENFRKGLSNLVVGMQNPPNMDPKILKRIGFQPSDSMYNQVTHLVQQAKEPIDLYNQTREATWNAYRYFAISGLVTLLGIMPLLSSEALFFLVYLAIVVAIIFAVFAWDDYNKNMKKLVKLRDAGE
jgi:hypothetical protein